MKEELTLVEVNNYIKHLKNFTYDISICVSNIEQIIESQNENLALKPIDGFIGHYVYLSYSNCTINCYNIFEKKETWSILKLCNKIEKFKFDEELNECIKSNQIATEGGDLIKSKEEFLQVVSKIKDEIIEKCAILKKVKDRRLKVYAHSDKDSSDFPRETLKDLIVVRDLAISVFYKINGGLNDSHYMFDSNIASISPVLEDRKYVDECWKKVEQNSE